MPVWALQARAQGLRVRGLLTVQAWVPPVPPGAPSQRRRHWGPQAAVLAAPTSGGRPKTWRRRAPQAPAEGRAFLHVIVEGALLGWVRRTWWRLAVALAEALMHLLRPLTLLC